MSHAPTCLMVFKDLVYDASVARSERDAVDDMVDNRVAWMRRTLTRVMDTVLARSAISGDFEPLTDRRLRDPSLAPSERKALEDKQTSRNKVLCRRAHRP
eukprot:6719664-Prymnesium_polylepis.1